MPRIALATCAEVPAGDDDFAPIVAALAERGVHAEPAVWDAADVAWQRYALVVVRATWDYAPRRNEFLAWAGRLPRVLNPHSVLAWNTDKRYLVELSGRGVPIVATTLLEPGDGFTPPPGRFVVKPAVSAGAWLSSSYTSDTSEAAVGHVHSLHAEGRTVMVQPYVDAIDEQGETGLVFMADAYSHAVHKEPLLPPEHSRSTALYVEETIAAVHPTPAERAVAERTLDALPFARSDLLYARVDLLPDAEGPVVLEVELTEPSLWLAYDDGAVERFAEAVVAAV